MSAPDLREVLTDFVISGEAGHPPALRRWTYRYPQFERELTELSARCPPDLETSRLARLEFHGERKRVEAAVPCLLAMLDKLPVPPDGPPIFGLYIQARLRGLWPREFEEHVGLPVTLLSMLEGRHIRFGSIPAAVLNTLSAALGVPVASVAKYLDGPPRIPKGVILCGRRRPFKMPEPIEFMAAVDAEPAVTEEHRKRWEEPRQRPK